MRTLDRIIGSRLATAGRRDFSLPLPCPGAEVIMVKGFFPWPAGRVPRCG
jgi:hypothetical protein